MLETFTLATFSPLIGSRFELTAPGQGDSDQLQLELSQASAGAAAKAVQREPFSLVFIGPVEPLLAQGTYRLSCEDLGAFELFIVPIARDQGGSRYEAVFA
jgi:hypothetical protein